jgi:plastocyanin
MLHVHEGSQWSEYTACRFLEDTIDSWIALKFVVQRRYLMLHRRSFSALIVLAALLAFVAGCASKTTPSPTPSSSTGGNNITVTAAGMAFDTSTITVSAGAHITITFINNDSGTPHNIAFYTSAAATTVIYKGARTTGVSTVTYTFDAPTTPGTYFFRCDVHPTTMTGEFIVQ